MYKEISIVGFINRGILSLILFTLALYSCKSKDVQTNDIIATGAKVQLIQSGFSFTEGPTADELGNVYFTDQPNDKIYVWNAKEGNVEEFLSPTERANGLFQKDGFIYTCADDLGRFWRINIESKKVDTLQVQPNKKRLNGPNDLFISNQNVIYFTDPFYPRSYWDFETQPQENRSVYAVTPMLDLLVIDSMLTQPNGIVASLDQNKLFVSDIDANETYSYNLKQDGTVSNKTLFCNLGSDGMTVDSKGNVYLTGHGVTVFDSTGQQIRHIEVPEKWTANVCFGGTEFSTLFITASESIYSLNMNTTGK